ncbi:hypothetical protein WA026_022334 [Henosepilachna vigintioctopunctata]|uniref:Uncharacterized protein n=1 Tax=Henosepilachna vigintioctopunctata TaxID=420089 RepID=A0AAW1UV93_9CUCU
MSTESPGPSMSRLMLQLSPKAKKTTYNVMNDKISLADVAELQIEISELYKQANIDQDRELINELNIISQVLSNNKSNSSSTDFKNKFTYNNTDQGPYFVYIEGKMEI